MKQASPGNFIVSACLGRIVAFLLQLFFFHTPARPLQSARKCRKVRLEKLKEERNTKNWLCCKQEHSKNKSSQTAHVFIENFFSTLAVAPTRCRCCRPPNAIEILYLTEHYNNTAGDAFWQVRLALYLLPALFEQAY